MSVDTEISEREQCAVAEAKEIVEDATFPERVASELRTGVLFATAETDELIRTVLDTPDHERYDRNDDVIAASRALLRRAGIDDTLL